MRRNMLLIVDDAEINRAVLRVQFEEEYNIMEAENGEQAMMLIRQYRNSLAAILLDIIMPVKDGYEVLAEMEQEGLLAGIPVILITSEDSMENEVRAFDLGASDIIIKPFEPHVIRRRIQNAVELNRHKVHLEEMVEEQAAKLRESRDAMMDTLASIIEHRSAETGQHVMRIRMFTKVLLEEVLRCCPECGLDGQSINTIVDASSLHDIGKIAIPDTILNKPGRLTREEFEIMKTHAVKGCEILASMERMDDQEYLSYAYNICRHHHERWDGKGYPDGLSGADIPIYAQVVGIADCYDALTTDRVYHKALPAQKAAAMINDGECGQFSPQLLECFRNVSDQFAALALSYADGQPINKASGFALQAMSPKTVKPQTETEAVQTKYFTLLRYVDRTILEVDMSLGVHHLIYQQNEDFQDLQTSETFGEALHYFTESSVHPDDRPLALEILDTYIEDFIDRGLMKRTVAYRVLHRATGAYVWYEATVMRVNVDNPKNHTLLIIWRLSGEDVGKPAAKPQIIGVPTIQDLPVGVQQCLSDRWFTITYVNAGFISLFGYTEQDLEERFNNHYIDIIYPDDRETVKKHFLNQINISDVQVLEYRAITKQGQLVWILDKCRVITGEDGREYLNCVLTDITQVRQAQEALRMSMEKYQIIFNQTNDIVFEWDILNDKINYSPNWKKLFGYAPLTSGEQARTVSHILPEDVPNFIKLMQNAASGTIYGETEIRIANAEGRYLWCRIRETTQFDSSGKPVKAVGVIVDIDDEKRQAAHMN